MNIKKILFVMVSILTLGLTYVIANNNLWEHHLESDVRTFHNRYTQFFEQRNFANFEGNEYLPGSLFFFIIPGILNTNLNYDEYLKIIIIVNLILIGLHFIIYKKMGDSDFSLFPQVLFLALGPILLFRFELLVSLLFLISIYLFTKEKYVLAGVFLGLSIMTKIYPLFILPYFTILLFKKDQISKILWYSVGIFIGVIIPIGLYSLMGGNVGDSLKNLLYHAEKPIMIESLFGSIVSIESLIKINILPQIILGNGVWGIPINSFIFNNAPYLMLMICYLLLLFKIKSSSNFTINVPIIILFIFIFFSKYLNPQYLFWVFGLFPLIGFQRKSQDWLLIFNTLLLLVLTQLTYPIYFSTLLDSFNSGVPNLTFYILQIRNTLLVIDLIILGTYLNTVNNPKTL